MSRFKLEVRPDVDSGDANSSKTLNVKPLPPPPERAPPRSERAPSPLGERPSLPPPSERDPPHLGETPPAIGESPLPPRHRREPPPPIEMHSLPRDTLAHLPYLPALLTR